MVNQRLLNQLLQANFLNSIWKNRHKFTKMANHLTFCFNVFQINQNCQLISAAKKMRTVPHCTCATTGDGKKLFSPFFSAKSFHSVILQIDSRIQPICTRTLTYILAFKFQLTYTLPQTTA